MCLPYLAFVGFGLHCLLTALIPSSSKKDWRHWKLYVLVNFLPGFFDSFLERFGFVSFGLTRHRLTPVADFNEKAAISLYYVFATTFLLLGIGGLALIVYRSIS
jgi:hypothetical protein